MSILVSAIVPTYNYGHFLDRAVDSVLRQTHHPTELIVVDDGSTDNTAEVLGRYGDRIKVITLGRSGLSAARNAGVRAASGEFVAFLDSDDWWHAEKIARQVAWFGRHPESGVVGCGRVHVDPDLKELETLVFSSGGDDRIKNLRQVALRRLWVGGSGSGAMVPRRVLGEIGLFDESLSAAEDWDLWLRIAARYSIQNTPEVLTYIRRHLTGTFRKAPLMQAAQLRVLAKAQAAWPEAFTPAFNRQVRAMIFDDAGAEYASAGLRAKAIGYCARGLAEWPFVGSRWLRVARMAASFAARR